MLQFVRQKDQQSERDWYCDQKRQDRKYYRIIQPGANHNSLFLSSEGVSAAPLANELAWGECRITAAVDQYFNLLVVPEPGSRGTRLGTGSGDVVCRVFGNGNPMTYD